MKKVKLHTHNNKPTIIFGIISAENELKVTWSINNTLSIQLVKKENLSINTKAGIIHYSCFKYENELSEISYELVNNKNSTSRFLEELKNVDYLLIIRGEIQENIKLQHHKDLKTSEFLTSVIEIPIESIRKKDILDLI